MATMLERGLNLIVKPALVLAVLCGLMLTGCSEDERDSADVVAPEGVMKMEAFVEVLADVHLAEAAYKSHVFRNDEEEAKLLENYAQIFVKHGITEEQFNESHTWWWEHPVAMKEVLLEVTEKLSEMESEISGANP